MSLESILFPIQKRMKIKELEMDRTILLFEMDVARSMLQIETYVAQKMNDTAKMKEASDRYFEAVKQFQKREEDLDKKVQQVLQDGVQV
jgi:hypothetical protein